MKKVFLLSCLVTVSLFAIAQIAIDLTGEWTGKRFQYDWNQEEFIQEFEYSFDLKQEGDRVYGTSTILNSNGDYADIKVQGMVVGNSFHFQEYEVMDEMKPDNKVWCYKVGKLDIESKNNSMVLEGKTKSYMTQYYFPCSGGYTVLERANENNDVNQANNTYKNGVTEEFNIGVYPNPFVSETSISYQLNADAPVNVAIFDMSGRLVDQIIRENQKAGNYQYRVDGSSMNAGVYIIKMEIGDQRFSEQLIKVQN